MSFTDRIPWGSVVGVAVSGTVVTGPEVVVAAESSPVSSDASSPPPHDAATTAAVTRMSHEGRGRRPFMIDLFRARAGRRARLLRGT
jgi:hypothetical protein